MNVYLSVFDVVLIILFRTLTCNRLFQKKAKPRLFYFGLPLKIVRTILREFAHRYDQKMAAAA